jgi:hypothetical protein
MKTIKKIIASKRATRMDPGEPQEEEEEELDDLQQFNILLSILVDLGAITDYDVCT